MPLLTARRERNLVLLLTVAATGLLLMLTFDVAAAYQVLFAGSFVLIALALLGLSLWRLALSFTEHRPFPTRPLTAVLGLALLTGLCYGWYHGAFYGRQVLSGVFIDDFSRLDLVLYEDGHYLIEEGWILGSERFAGRYTRSGDSLIFDNYSFTGPKAPNHVLTRRGSRLYFPSADTSFYHFQIQQP
ncbi:hypothetical protein EJV47_21540 [Hymenobacter gummosus]|uniref:Uncharacterized protein n=1 Tax=Hymenobacter gummosus TaxID=1776032 RepID=A0A3S0JBG9_9BACT|nr:hypothetical protein [Hymenobacter gummosus]RTQ46538.1 hypothetical protein EJV47_21540 [Hymenobacter gummosus]